MNDHLNILSLLSPKDVAEISAIPSEAVCGQFVSEDTSPESFRVNPVFVHFMHSVIENKGIGLPSLLEVARNQVDGYVYIIDFRTPDGIMGNVPIEDVVGAFQVTNGEIVANSYQPNEDYKVFTDNGLVKLPDELQHILIEELKKL